MIVKLLTSINNRILKLDKHTLEVFQKSSYSTLVKLMGMSIGLGVSVFLGRTIGADGLGIINLTNRIVSILLIIGLLGMRQVVIKEISIAKNNKDYSHVGNVMYTALLFNGLITLLISVTFILISPWLANKIFNEPRLTYPLMIALVAMTPQVFTRIFSSALAGYRKIWQSNLAERTLSVSIVGILLFIFWLFKLELDVKIVALFYAIGRITVTIIIGLYWNSLYRFKEKKNLIIKELLKISLPLFIVAASGIILRNADTIMLGILSESTAVGLYAVAARLALLTSFFLQITNSAVGPKIAALYEEQNLEELEIMVQRVTKGLGVIGVIVLLIFIFTGRSLLSFWGEEFTEAYWVLIILGIGQFINLSTGAVGLILVMTGYERIYGKVSILFLIINIILLYVLINSWGIIGAAIASAITIIIENLIKVIISKNKVGILTIPIRL